jgi:hypothetical protein
MSKKVTFGISFQQASLNGTAKYEKQLMTEGGETKAQVR